jgi:hypothetical protein
MPLRALLAERYNDGAWARPLPPLVPLADPRRVALVAAFTAAGYVFGPVGV